MKSEIDDAAPARKSVGGRRSRRKGNRIEREAVAVLQAAGIAAERIPLSGSAVGSFVGDITAPVLGVDRRLEVKARASGFGLIRRWLSGYYALVLKANRSDALIVLRLTDFAELAVYADRRRDR